MNNPNISSATIIPKLELMLNDDIAVLEKMISGRNQGDNISVIVKNLLEWKKVILDMLPTDDKKGGAPSTKSKFNPQTYSSVDHGAQDEPMILAKVLHKIEQDQFKFIQYALRSEGIPSTLQKTLNKILGEYSKITVYLNQISRSNNLRM